MEESDARRKLIRTWGTFKNPRYATPGSFIVVVWVVVVQQFDTKLSQEFLSKQGTRIEVMNWWDYFKLPSGQDGWMWTANHSGAAFNDSLRNCTIFILKIERRNEKFCFGRISSLAGVKTVATFSVGGHETFAGGLGCAVAGNIRLFGEQNNIPSLIERRVDKQATDNGLFRRQRSGIMECDRERCECDADPKYRPLVLIRSKLQSWKALDKTEYTAEWPTRNPNWKTKIDRQWPIFLLRGIFINFLLRAAEGQKWWEYRRLRLEKNAIKYIVIMKPYKLAEIDHKHEDLAVNIATEKGLNTVNSNPISTFWGKWCHEGMKGSSEQRKTSRGAKWLRKWRCTCKHENLTPNETSK